MSVPTQRRTSAKKRQRASHFGLKAANYRACSKCKKPVLPHRACRSCGTYKGKVVISPKKKALKK